jgi:hypothetical protein
VALRSIRTEQPAGEPPILPLDQHEQYARLAAMRRAIMAAQQDRQRRLDLLAIEGELARPATLSTGPRVALLKQRATELRAAAPEKPAAPDPAGLPLPIARALELARGETVEEPPDRQERLKRLRAELRILEAGFAAIDVAMEELRAELSHAVAQQLRPRHKQIMRSVWDAAAALSAAIDAERAIYASAITSGYADRPDILQRPALRAGAMLGSLQEWDSEISHLRRRLEQQGIL